MSTETLEKPPETQAIEKAPVAGDRPAGLLSFEEKFKQATEAAASKKAAPIEKAPEATKSTEAAAPTETSAPAEAGLDSEEIPVNPLLAAFNGKKKEEAAPVEGEPAKAEPESLNTDKETNLANLRKIAKAAQVERDEWKSKASKTTIPDDYEQLKADNKLMEEALKKVNLAETPQFKRKYDEKLSSSKKTIERVLANTDVTPAEFLAVVEAPDSKDRRLKIEQMTDGMDTLSRQTVMAKIGEYDGIRADRETELKNPDESLIKFHEETKTQAEARQRQFEGVIDEVWSQAEKDLPWLNISDDTPDEIKQDVAQMRHLATNAWRGAEMDPKARAALVIAGAAYPFHQKVIGALQSEVANRDAIIAKLRGATPNAGAQRATSEKGEPKRKGFIEAYHEGVASARGR